MLPAVPQRPPFGHRPEWGPRNTISTIAERRPVGRSRNATNRTWGITRRTRTARGRRTSCSWRVTPGAPQGGPEQAGGGGPGAPGGFTAAGAPQGGPEQAGGGGPVVLAGHLLAHRRAALSKPAAEDKGRSPGGPARLGQPQGGRRSKRPGARRRPRRSWRATGRRAARRPRASRGRRARRSWRTRACLRARPPRTGTPGRTPGRAGASKAARPGVSRPSRHRGGAGAKLEFRSCTSAATTPSPSRPMAAAPARCC